MNEVVEKEVIKLVDVGIIYPISNSQRDNPVQVVPKKSDIIMVKNNDGELTPIR